MDNQYIINPLNLHAILNFSFFFRYISFRFVSIGFVSFCLISFRFFSIQFVSIGFVSFRSVSYRFVSFLFRFALYSYPFNTTRKCTILCYKTKKHSFISLRFSTKFVFFSGHLQQHTFSEVYMIVHYSFTFYQNRMWCFNYCSEIPRSGTTPPPKIEFSSKEINYL